jgi:hypothetical protein
MLGARRATVTQSAGLLQAAGLIRYHHGRITIIDRGGLEAAACECYEAIEAELDGVVQRALRHSYLGVTPHHPWSDSTGLQPVDPRHS